MEFPGGNKKKTVFFPSYMYPSVHAAEEACWTYFRACMDRTTVNQCAAGRGPLGEMEADGKFYHGGTSHDFIVHELGKKQMHKGHWYAAWSRHRETFLSAKEFCTNCSKIKIIASFQHHWKCRGHKAEETTPNQLDEEQEGGAPRVHRGAPKAKGSKAAGSKDVQPPGPSDLGESVVDGGEILEEVGEPLWGSSRGT